MTRNRPNRSFDRIASPLSALFACHSFPAHQPLYFLVVYFITVIPELRRDPAVAVHALVFEKDLLHPPDQSFVLPVPVGPANTVIVCGTCYTGDLKQNVQPVFLPQFCYNAYFFFCCRDFLA